MAAKGCCTLVATPAGLATATSVTLISDRIVPAGVRWPPGGEPAYTARVRLHSHCIADTAAGWCITASGWVHLNRPPDFTQAGPGSHWHQTVPWHIVAA